MDIYEWAEENNADYLDPHTGLIYKVQEYNQAKKFGLPTLGICVIDPDGNFLGYAKKKEENQ